MENKFICIHGHFYQPPREHAWLEAIERQDSAYPFHDWNERINYECYAPNASARILNSAGKITHIVNNYSRISFNFGPTLLNWMEKADPNTYASILEADEKSLLLNNGHGSAIAQAYNHLIMPLCNRRDKETQVIWGIKDFEYRFNRKPEGMWLPETAVDSETLEICVDHGIQFVILAPRQAKSIRSSGETNWREVNADSIDTRKAYKVNLESGKHIAVYFYDGKIAQEVAFNGLLNNGKSFAERLVSNFSKDSSQAQLINIATDGESYGHHHRYGEMALADCLKYIEDNKLARISNYGQFLAEHPATWEAQIHEDSSWSCVHGIGRWKSNCGCHTGGQPSWNQEWRDPLRTSLNWLRDKLIPIFEKEGELVLRDPWKAREQFIQVILNRDTENVDAFVNNASKGTLNPKKKSKILRLLEMQRNSMMMFTSCGWFFDEISGLETLQILQYACRAIYYAKQVGDVDLESKFISKLAKAKSNLPEHGTGADIYKNMILPGRVDLKRVGMHYAVTSIFEENPEEMRIFNYVASSSFFDRLEGGTQKLAIGSTSVRSIITHSEKHFSFAVLYLGQHNIIGNISTNMREEVFLKMHEVLTEQFEQSNLGQVIEIMQVYFGEDRFTMRHLFNDEKRAILNRIIELQLEKVEENYREIYGNNYQLMNASLQSGNGVPEAFKTTVKFVLRTDLNRLFTQSSLDKKTLHRLLREFTKWGVPVGAKQSFLLTASERLYEEIRKIQFRNEEAELIEQIKSFILDFHKQGVKLEIWKIQNQYFSLAKKWDSTENSSLSVEWTSEFIALGNALDINLDSMLEEKKNGKASMVMDHETNKKVETSGDSDGDQGA